VLVVAGAGAWAPLLGDVLTEHGASVIRVSNFEQGMLHLTKEINTVFTEVRIGRERCFGFLSRVLGCNAHASVVAISGNAPLRDIFLLRDYGVRHFIEYPVSRPKVEAILAAQASSNEARTFDVPLACKTARMTAMEQATLDCVIRGMTHKEIAANRGVSANTVKSQIRSILSKMGVSNQKQLLSKMMHARAASSLSEVS
jgi:DNA-binding NarL/FixJ family response regulator